MHKAKYDRLHDMAALCGRVRADAWQRCRGLSTAPQSVYAIRNAWMAEGYDWHGLPARLGKAALSDALGDIAAARDAAKVPVKKAIRHRTRGNPEERHRLYSLLKRNRWDEDSFLHRQMRRQWQGGSSHCTNQIVADTGSYTTKVWHGRAWVHLQGLERGRRIAIPLRGTHLPTRTLRIILQDDGQMAVHYAIDETTVCSTKPCGDGELGVDKGYTEAHADSAGERHGEGLGDLLAAESDAGDRLLHLARGGRDDLKFHLDFPNRDVAGPRLRDILSLAAHASALDQTLVPDLRACLATGDGFGGRLEYFVFGTAHENLQQETGYRALLQALFLLMAVPTQSEPSNWGGRADHEVQIGHRVMSSRSSTTGPRTQPCARSETGSTDANTWGPAAR